MMRPCDRLRPFTTAASILVALGALSLPARECLAQAFPGAEGFGSATRGAYALYELTGDPADLPQIIHVTNTDDAGPGSFREAVGTVGPRIIVFDLGGTIFLESNIKHDSGNIPPDGMRTPPYMTIAGQTAPGDGICIRNASVDFTGTHDIIVRGLRFRAGLNPNIGNNANFSVTGSWWTPDAVSHDIMIDHISSSWSTGKLITTYYNIHHVSITNSMFVEPLQNCGSECPKSDHNYAITTGGGTKHVTVAHNIIVHSRYRNPLFGRGTGTSAGMEGLSACSYAESVNNVVFNDGWGSFCAASNSGGGAEYLPSYVASVGDHRIAGPDSPDNRYQYVLREESDTDGGGYLHPESKVFLSGNLSHLRTSQDQPESAVFNNDNTAPSDSMLVGSWDEAFEKSNVTVVDAQESYDDLVTHGVVDGVPKAGAYPRDMVDELAVQDIVEGTGRWISHEDEGRSGGFVEYDPGEIRPDADQDGMPDEWESSHGLDPDDPADAHEDRDDDGFRNIEEYVNSFFLPAADPGSGGAGGAGAAGGVGGSGGTTAVESPAEPSASLDEAGAGCGCAVAGSSPTSPYWLALCAGLVVLGRRRRRVAIPRCTLPLLVVVLAGCSADDELLAGAGLAGGGSAGDAAAGGTAGHGGAGGSGADGGAPAPGEPLAFPGAEGFGATTRGAYALFESTGDPADLPQVIHVKNTDDSGPGSLREAIDTAGPRIVVFDTGGTIELESNLEMDDHGLPAEAMRTPPYLTIAGQTAPGDGICITNGAVGFKGTHDVVVRGLRVRTGVSPHSGNGVSFSTRGSYWHPEEVVSENVIFDHNSISWSTGKLAGTWQRARNISYTNNMFVEPLQNCGSECPRSDHNYGLLFGPGGENVTVAHNVLVHSRFRNPLFGGGGSDVTALRGITNAESVSNIIYNGRYWQGVNVARNQHHEGGDQPQNVVFHGEYHIAGPNTAGEPGAYTFGAMSQQQAGSTGNPQSYVHDSSRMYVFGNLTPRRTDLSQDEWDIFAPGHLNEAIKHDQGWPFTRSNVVPEAAQASYDRLVADGVAGGVPTAGAVPRDLVDARAIEDIMHGTGGWITQPSEGSAGGLPPYDPGTPRLDTDQDGMPDEWERSHGLDPEDPADAHLDRDEDGYWNVEEYINSFFVAG